MASIQGALKVDVVATITGAPHKAVEVVTAGASLVEAVQLLVIILN